MPASELTEWMAFYRLEPFGVERDNYHAGLIASLLYNVHRGKKNSPMSPDDFMLRDIVEKKERDTAAFLGGLRSLAQREVDD